MGEARKAALTLPLGPVVVVLTAETYSRRRRYASVGGCGFSIRLEIRCDTGPLGGIDLGLQHPSAQRFRTDADLRADRLAGGIHRPILVKVIQHHLHRALTPLDR